MNPLPRHTLLRRFEVAGRQGVATDGTHIWVSGCTATPPTARCSPKITLPSPGSPPPPTTSSKSTSLVDKKFKGCLPAGLSA